MNIFEKNKLNIDRRISLGVDLLKKNYELNEIELREFKNIHIQNMDYTITQYEIKGVGNLLIMACRDCETLQMDSFVITPYYKNLPLFSTDYIYTGEKRSFLNEIYNLVDKKDELYNTYINEFSKVKSKYDYFKDMTTKSAWYDNIRPVCIAKNTGVEDDEEIINIFINNLKIFIQMEKETPMLNEEEYKIKWKKTQDYANRLVDDGGAATNLFKAVLGADKTKEFFNSVFFAPSIYSK